MDENDSENLDLEFKRYLQLLRPYLGQLLDQDVIKLCDAWIKRLSNCKENEKALRNKYIFLLCYQLAKGVLEGPFLKCPSNELLPLTEDFNSDDSSYDFDYVVTDSEELNTQILYNSKNVIISDTEYLSHDDDKNCNSVFDSDKYSEEKKNKVSHYQNVLCYTCPDVTENCYSMPEEEYECRANNLVKKLREIKKQNMLLQKELVALKVETTMKPEELTEKYIVKLDNATSAFICSNDSNSTMKSLKCKLQEVQESRNILIERISILQDQLDSVNEIKNNEIEDIKANHKLEIINIKTAIRDETKDYYEKKLEDTKLDYETKIKEMQNKLASEVQELIFTKDEIINDKNKLLNEKAIENARLKNELDEQKNNLNSVLNRFIDKPNNESDTMNLKTQQMERRINRMEKSKIKCAKHYEAKLRQLQRDKHLAECSLQLQLVRQRAQVVSELTDENQTELSNSLEKLESKYKEIVSNVQATAIQRRMQDQIALEAILQVACGNDFQGQVSRNMRNQSQSYETEISSLLRSNKASNGNGGNKSFGDDSLVMGYCLNGERMNELFERVYIPQRDTSEAK